MSSRTMTKEEVRQIARNIMIFREGSAPFDLYSDIIMKHLLFLPWFVEALIRRALLFSPKCLIKYTQPRDVKKPVLDNRLLVTYQEPGEEEYKIVVNVEVQKRSGERLMSLLAFNACLLIRDYIKIDELPSPIRNVYTITLMCQNMVRFKGKPEEQYLHFTCGDELLERLYKDRNMVQHVFLEVNKFNRNTDAVNRDGCLFEAFMYIAKRWSVLTEDMLVEMILTGGHMAEGAFQLSQLNNIPKEAYEDRWLAIETQKEQEQLALAEVKQKEAEVKQEGKQEGIAAVARRMLSNGLDVEIISLSTGLTSEEITKLADSTVQ